MKNMFKMIVALLAVGTIVSCDPVEDRDSLPAITLDASEINISVTIDPSDPNKVIMTNLTEDVIPYWNYTNAAGDDLGHSNLQTTSTVFPFAGTYTVYFTAYTRGGAVAAQPVNITIANNDEDYFSAAEWGYLTNGTEGKTWVLDMDSPIGWCGLDYPASSGDNWAWFPTYNDASWAMVNKDWGSMTFNLDGNYNVSISQTALATTDQTTKTGTFSLNLDTDRLIFNGGPEMLYGGDYYPDCSNWVNVHVLEITETSLRLAVVRDQSRTGEGQCQIMFHYKPAE
ncbi:hypothetical protein ACLI1A_13065 [Flavobacterium sp. RHBU_3]|uniref:hypothetical protein n=1 Tax=Flavobacterium sp. RHBU_3 TaxID=3391184 RepID=UPI0039851D8C